MSALVDERRAQELAQEVRIVAMQAEVQARSESEAINHELQNRVNAVLVAVKRDAALARDRR